MLNIHREDQDKWNSYIRRRNYQKKYQDNYQPNYYQRQKEIRYFRIIVNKLRIIYKVPGFELLSKRVSPIVFYESDICYLLKKYNTKFSRVTPKFLKNSQNAIHVILLKKSGLLKIIPLPPQEKDYE